MVEDFCSATRMVVTLSGGAAARVDRVDEALLARMADAGCGGIFFGVETGSQRMQSAVRKNLRLDRVMPVMRTCVDHGMAPTGSFITGFPDETIDDALDSFTMALDILQLSARTSAQMHLCAAGEPALSGEKGRSAVRWAQLRYLDVSPGRGRDSERAPLSRHLSQLLLHSDPAPRSGFGKAISAVIYTCPTVFLALRSAGADLRDVLIGWTEWQRRHLGQEQRGQDYYLYQFGLDLCRYLEVEVLPLLAPTAPYLPDLVSYFAVCHGLKRGLIRERTVFHQYEYDVRTLTQSVRTTDAVLDPPPDAFDLLFVNLAECPRARLRLPRGECSTPQDPLVRPGDALEIRDPVMGADAAERRHPETIRSAGPPPSTT